MQLKTFSKAIKLLPEEIQNLPVHEVKILEYKKKLVLIHKHHQARFFNEGKWEEFKAPSW